MHVRRVPAFASVQSAVVSSVRRHEGVLTSMTATMTIVSDNAAAAAAVGSPPGFANDRGTSRSVVFFAGGAGSGDRARAGVPATRPAGVATVQDLLGQRADLPAGHPDRAALRARSIEAGLPLARWLSTRYRGRGEPLDDLYQVAALALVKAVDGYDPAREAAFTSYAVPTIVGALKRHLRDTTWRLRVPRRIQELAINLASTSARLAQQLGRSPTPRDLAAHLDAAEQDVAIALNAWQAHHPDSLDALSATGGEEQRPLVDTIGAIDARFDAVIDRHTLQPLLAALPVRERRILAMRYFGDMTQAEIAAQVGVSQMQISRLLVRTLMQLRTGMLVEPAPALNAPGIRRARSRRA
jgi:RNA polymerase sigma-B factor